MSRALLLLIGLASPALVAQETATAAFLERARAGTEQYRDVKVALAHGYRPIGHDAPAMGVHWLNPRLALAGSLDPERPAILTYVTVGERLELVGVGYVVPLGPGEEPPEGPAGRHAWHFHSRTVVEESVAPGRHAPDAMHHGPRAAVLHAWVWVENPAGPFTPENWALPYHRLGLALPAGAPIDAAQALALATDEGLTYYADRLRLMKEKGDETALSALRWHEGAVRAWLDSRNDGPLAEREVAWLAGTWNTVRQELRQTHPDWERDRMP